MKEKKKLRKDILKKLEKRGNAIWSYAIRHIESELEEENYLLFCYDETEAESFRKYCGKGLIDDIVRYNVEYNNKPKIHL